MSAYIDREGGNHDLCLAVNASAVPANSSVYG